MNELTITLPQDLAAALRAKAERRGTTPEELALALLRGAVAPGGDGDPAASATGLSEEPAEGETLYDRIKPLIGSLNSSEYVPGGAQFSRETGRAFAKALRKKHGREEP